MKYNEQNTKSFNSYGYILAYSRNDLAPIEESIIDKYFISKGKTLDIGCGTGRTTVNLLKKKFDVIGIDIADKLIEEGKKRHPELDLRLMNAINLSFLNKSFDNILFPFNGIDYIYPKKDRLLALTEIYRVLKPGAIFAFNCHNSHFIPNNFGRIRNYLKNLITGRVFRDYKINYQKKGNLIVHHQSISKQIKELEQIGFKIKDMITKHDKHKRYFQFIEPGPYYICTKR